MKVDEAATANTGIWITFVGVTILYIGLGITTILVLRMMSNGSVAARRTTRPMSRRTEPATGDDEDQEGASGMSDAAAVILFAAVTVYALFGGADFGAGFWDLIAGGAKRGERPREVIDHSIAPVWEANHVWLIFIFVLLWTCFPEAYASIMLTLFVPLTLAALGIVLRGASFAFRKAVIRTRDQRNFGAAFASSSVLVPYCFGAVVGASPRAGSPPAAWPVTLVQLGQPDLDPRRRPRRRPPRTWPPSSWSSTQRGSPTRQMVAYFRRRASRPRGRRLVASSASSS